MQEERLDDFSHNNRVTLVNGGKHYFDHLLHLIASAVESLHLQTYIFADDITGSMVAEALVKASGRGVNVFLMVDGYASQSLSKSFIKRLKSEGIKFKFFELLFRSRRFYLGRRLHHKVCVADLSHGLVGGINVADHYNDIPGNPPWLDFALSVEGELVKDLYILCQKTWNGFQPLLKTPPLRGLPVFAIPEDAKVDVRMRRNDWVRRKYQISLSYLEMFTKAKSHIIILSSYFLPGRLFRKAIRRARERGVKITVIVAGISDVKMAKLAERYMYEWLLMNNVVIMEYNATILHGKLGICDGKWITLGSFNMNDISTYASVELNLDVRNETFAKELQQYLEENVIKYTTTISSSYVKEYTTWWVRLLQWSSFIAFRALLYSFTFYFKRIVRTE